MDRKPSSTAGALIAEHRSLFPGINALRKVADDSTYQTREQLVAGLVECDRFLQRDLLPHAGAEDEVMYPAVDRALGAPGATLTMSIDHREIERLSRELGMLIPNEGSAGGDPAWAGNVRRVLYSLHAILNVHMAKEEEIYLPVLDSALTGPQADALFEEMERAAAKRRLALAQL